MSSQGTSAARYSASFTAAVDASQAEGHAAMGKIARSGSANILGAGVSAAANFLLVVIVSRLWSAEIAGTLFAVSSIFLIGLALCQLGVDQGLVRFIAWNSARNEQGKNRFLMLQGVSAAMIASIIVALLGTLLALPLAQLLSSDGSTPETRSMIVIFSWALPVAAGYELLLALTRGMMRMRPTIIYERIMRPMLQLGTVIAAGAAGLDPSALAVAWVLPYAVGLVGAGITTSSILRRTQPQQRMDTPRQKSAQSADFWKYTAPRGLARLAQVTIQRADIAIVTIIAGPAPAAVYTAATRFLVMGQLATSAIQQVSEPQLSRLLSRRNHDGTRIIAQKLTLWSVLLAWPVYLLCIVYAGFLLEFIFGARYAAGAESLWVLALAMLFATAMGPLDVLLLMAGRSSLSLLNTSLALTIDVVGCLFLIPQFGISGAALAWAAAIVTKNVLCGVQVYRTLHVTPLTMEIGLTAVGLILVFGVVPLLLHTVLQVRPPTEIVVLMAAAAAYAVLLWVRRKALLPRPSLSP